MDIRVGANYLYASKPTTIKHWTVWRVGNFVKFTAGQVFMSYTIGYECIDMEDIIL